MERFSNVTAVDISSVQEAVEQLVGQVTLAIRFMALFSLVTGAVVLIGAVATSRYQRVREGALLRTLGATRAQILRVVVAEYAALGLHRGARGAWGLAIAAAWALATLGVRVAVRGPGRALPGSALLVVAGTALVGLLNSREVVRRAPLEVLRGGVGDRRMGCRRGARTPYFCTHPNPTHMLPIDLTGKRAFVAGVADDGGFGFAIAKALAEAGASVCVGTWPPALGIFLKLLERGKMDESMRS